ncbi:N-acyl-D-amino-acid deacylase family protein [Angustibacter sp. McL0619]|uniref:N-acyl-D-amino-acid deacylase family protein n=1 Tax=Angustibacter sp. McL0619 TaxID=3415676 RepID=UPI003CF34DF5
MTADLLIRGATVLDGTGRPGVTADVVVADGRIAAMDPTGQAVAAGQAATARRVVQADGLVLCPGLIDMHAHSDLQILAAPDHTAKVSQGVTTEVLGQDGLSFAPVDDAVRARLLDQIAGWNGDSRGVETQWTTVAGYLDRLDQGIACNAAYLVPQGTLRLLVMGDEAREATASELDRMVALLRQGMVEGAFGMSSGLTYPPGMFAGTDELVRLCEVVAERGGYYSPHTRSYGRGALEAYAEMVDVARRSGCALHLTHATMNFEPNRGRADELLALVDRALDDGVDVTLDTYPYLPGSTTLSALLPSWALAGGTSALLQRLGDPDTRARITHELEDVGTDGCHGCPVDWTTIQVSGVRDPACSPAVGRTVAELAQASGRPPAQEYFDLLVADRAATTILQHVGDEANVRAIMAHPRHCGGSDAILVGDRPHPRAWGTFPRYLARYVRELGVLDLAECVHHLTGLPARRLGLVDRGLVREGFAADLVLFDPATVRDVATFEQPRQPAEGIELVLVNGVAVMDGGNRTSDLPGTALRHFGVTVQR